MTDEQRALHRQRRDEIVNYIGNASWVEDVVRKAATALDWERRHPAYWEALVEVAIGHLSKAKEIAAQAAEGWQYPVDEPVADDGGDDSMWDEGLEYE